MASDLGVEALVDEAMQIRATLGKPMDWQSFPLCNINQIVSENQSQSHLKDPLIERVYPSMEESQYSPCDECNSPRGEYSNPEPIKLSESIR